jgi:phosphate transport system substrate-binding protein
MAAGGGKEVGFMKLFFRYLLFGILFLASFMAESAAAAPSEKKLIIAGSGAGIGVMRRVAEGFQKRHPDVSIDLLPSIGSTGGIRAVKQGRIDIGLSSRPLAPEERTMGMIEAPYGRTLFIFAVQESNPTQGVTLTEIEDLYAAKRKIWPDGTPVRLILRPLRDSSSLYLASINPRLKSASEKAHAIPGVFVGMTDQEAAGQIEKTPGSFGTISACLMAVEKRKIKALPVDGVVPALSNIADGVDVSAGKYPYTMTMSLVYKGETDKGDVREFVRFVFSKDGRKILSESGHVALPRIAGK